MSGLLNNASFFVAAIFPSTALTSGPSFGHAGVPNLVRRSRRLCHSPQSGEKSGFSCFLPPLRPLAFLGLQGCGYILAEQRPDVRETQAALLEPGSVVSAFFCAQPSKSSRCIMLRFLLSSRFLRFRYRLVSVFHSSVAVALFGALLVLPAVYLWEVL